MDYVVFDLEWNQCPQGKEKEDSHLPFEIIEIGAIKLNDKREVIDKFQALVKPQVYKWIHTKTREVIHMDYKSLMSGKPFPTVAREFLEWCGEDYMLCTWGDLDIMELQRNLKYYHKKDYLKGPLFYYDIQKIFGLNFMDDKSRKSLEYAIDYLEIPKEQTFHRALSDAYYTAQIFQKLDWEYILQYYSVDVYQNPKSRKEEVHVFYKEYEKYVSKEFSTKEAAMKDREVASTKCPLCHKAARRKIRWFTPNSRHYYSLSWCEEHGYIKGKIRMKKTEEGNTYAVKTLKPVGDEEAKILRERQETLRFKRKLKRRQEKLFKNKC